MSSEKQNYLQMRAYYKRKIKTAKEKLQELDNQYIKKNAPYPIGAKLRIDVNGTERLVVIESYDIKKSGFLLPIFEGVGGIIIAYSKYTILEEIK